LLLGTLRLWHLPDCIQLNEFQSKEFTSSAEEIFYGSSSNSEDNKSSSIDYSIWKLDISSSDLDNVFIALSIYSNRTNSIYLTTLSNLEKSTKKLTFNSTSGTIMDYYFHPNSKCDLFVLFDNNTLLKVNINSILSCDKKEFFEENNQIINTILSNNEFNLMNNIISNEMIFKQLFKARGDPGDSSYYKRKNERIEQQKEKRWKKK
jgi:hypothetical protein